MTDERITEYAEEIRRLDVLIKEQTAQMESLKEELKAEMKARGIKSLQAGLFKVSYSEYTQQRFDSKAFKEANKDLYEQYCKSYEVSRLLIH